MAYALTSAQARDVGFCDPKPCLQEHDEAAQKAEAHSKNLGDRESLTQKQRGQKHHPERTGLIEDGCQHGRRVLEPRDP